MDNQKTIKINKKPQRKLFRNLILGCFVLVAGFLSYSSIKEVIKSFQLNQELKIAKEELQKATAKQEELSETKVKLEDSEYVQNYARGSHLVSNQDEEIFILIPSE